MSISYSTTESLWYGSLPGHRRFRPLAGYTWLDPARRQLCFGHLDILVNNAGLLRDNMLFKDIPLRRMGTPEDIAGVVASLVSDDAAYISGETIYVAGGPAGMSM